MIEAKTQYSPANVDQVRFRAPTVKDGSAVWQLVHATGVLEVNTAYFYLIFCSEFQNSSLVAEHDGQVVGVVLGYRRPKSLDTLFCWQIGVLPAWQGKGLAKLMLHAWISLAGNPVVNAIEATVADDNAASDRLFRALARDLSADCEVTPCFTSDLLPEGHRPEPLYRIAPIAPSQNN
jgi:L-2,4-diaminobutyric acid acetyltransferase